MDRIGHYINNAVITDEANRTSPVFNPAVGKQIAEVELASKSQVEEAISAAAAAFGDWSKTPPVIRARILFSFKELIEKNRDQLARIITTQHGKSYRTLKES